jgi:hypothetical protein
MTQPFTRQKNEFGQFARPKILATGKRLNPALTLRQAGFEPVMVLYQLAQGKGKRASQPPPAMAGARATACLRLS